MHFSIKNIYKYKFRCAVGSKLLSCKRAVNLSSSDSSPTHYNCPSEVICPHIGIDLDLFLDLSLFSLAN